MYNEEKGQGKKKKKVKEKRSNVLFKFCMIYEI